MLLPSEDVVLDKLILRVCVLFDSIVSDGYASDSLWKRYDTESFSDSVSYRFKVMHLCFKYRVTGLTRYRREAHSSEELRYPIFYNES